MPRKAKRSKKGVAAKGRTRASNGTSNLMPQASSQGHSVHLEPQPHLLEPTPPQAPVPPLGSTPHSLAHPSASTRQPHTTKLNGCLVVAEARTRASHGASNLMAQASSQGHSVPLEPQSHLLEPTPAQALVPPLGSTPHSLAPPSAPLGSAPHALAPPSAPTRQPHATKSLSSSTRRMPIKEKHSKNGVATKAPPSVSHGTSNVMPQTSSQGYSISEDPQPDLLESTLGPLLYDLTPPWASTRAAKRRGFSGVLDLQAKGMSHEAERSKNGIATRVPSRISHGTSNMLSQASSHRHSVPVEPQEDLLEPTLPQPVVPPLGSTPQGLTPPSAPTRRTRATKRHSSQAKDILRKAKRLKNGVATRAPSHGTSNLMSQASSQVHSDHVEPQPHVLELTPDALSPPLAPPQSSRSSKLRSSKPGRECARAWTVQAIDEQGNEMKIQVTNPGVFDMPQGQRIVVPFDRQMRACGEAAALLSGACGRISTKPDNIPIYFESWPKVPDSYKKECFNALKNLFHFQASEVIAKRYCYLTMGRKYRNHKLNLWKLNFNPSYSREQLIEKVPNGIPEDQWPLFVDYHLKPEYMEMCQKNVEARKKQTIPHTGGSKLLSRRQQEMEEEAGHAVGRGELYIATHKKKDGSYVNAEARSIVEKLEEQLGQLVNTSEIASNDALAKVLGPDHAGRVRSLGLGGLHSVAFASTTTRFSVLGNLSNTDTAEPSQLKEEVDSLRLKLASYEENIKTLQTVLISYIEMKEGTVPEEFGGLLGTPSADQEKEGDAPTSEGGESSLNSNRV
ncbi:uncharacterized protein LOC130723096 [Lotus japonicus]|uniref:uncharacterized protein LOC130723096 n=1 Tax=Lotus japonicus TaxID=34305 RepID=UPI002586EA91|nr:uncharacterized protein LOC130723096 [Lotus japonicus]